MQRRIWLIIGSIAAVLAATLSLGWAFAQNAPYAAPATEGPVAPRAQREAPQNGQNAQLMQGQGRRGPPEDRPRGDGVCDGSNMVDADGDGVCDNAGSGQGRRGPPEDRPRGDGVCDGSNMVDADGDGVCDNGGRGPGQGGNGRGQGRGRNQP